MMSRLVKISIGADFRKNSSVFITAISTLDWASRQKSGALMRAVR
jgi:hypothetical protein